MKTPQPVGTKTTRFLNLSTKAWFIIVFIGQLIFAYYILSLYGKNGIQGNLEKWNAQTTHGYKVNDLLGNVIFGIHVALAAIITIGGPLQLISMVRNKFPKFHRINGRIYFTSAIFISLAGLYLAWVRGAAGGLTGAIFITINGLIILLCAVNTLRFALTKQFGIHYKWAVRLFLAMSGVWFFRVFLMLWLVIHQAPVGFDPETFEGPFLNALSVLVYVLPVGFAELFYRAKSSNNSSIKFTMSLFLVVLTIGTAVGIVAATMGMWLPVL